MKMILTKFTALLAVGLLIALALPAQATVYQIVTNTATYNGLDGFIVTNLLQTGQSSLGSVVTSHSPSGGWAESGLNDGAGNAVLNGQAGLVFYPSSGTGLLRVTITFNLNTNNGTGGATNGYDLNSLQAISGWSGASLGNQNFQVLLSINGGPFNNYGSFVGTSTLGSGNNSVMTTVASSSGPIARNVTAIQFVFSLSPTGNGGIVIHELQAFGTPSPTNVVPAPYRICAVGDSITAGYLDNSVWPGGFQYGFRSGLATSLTTNGTPFQFVGNSPEPWNGLGGPVPNIPSPDLRIAGQDHHEGYGGKTTAFVLGNLSAWLQVDQPDVMLLMIGINDLGQGSSGEPTGPEQNLSNIVATVVSQSPNTRLIVAQITPYASYSDSIVRYNTYIANTLVPYFAGQGKFVSTVNQYTNLCFPGTTNINSALFSNGINHPTDAVYNLMAQTWFNGIKALSLPGTPRATTASPNLVINGGFEVPIYTTAAHNLVPQGSGWGYTYGGSGGGGSGIDKGLAYGQGGANSYDGAQQRACLQGANNGTVTHLYQAVSGFTVGQFYQLSFWAEGIGAFSGADPFHVNIISGTTTNLLSINGSTSNISPPTTGYVRYTSAPFQASNTVMTLDFADQAVAGTYVSWVDGVGIYAVSNINLLVNGGFEVPAYGSNSHNINPSGNGWTFTAGVNGAGSGIDRGDPYGSSGSIEFQDAQQACLQSSGNSTVMSISQTVSNLTVGQYYQVSFAAKGIAGFTGSDPFQVQLITGTTTNLLFGGSDVIPSAAGYTYYTSVPFQATNSVMTLSFADHGLSASTYVSFIDGVSFYPVPPPTLMAVSSGGQIGLSWPASYLGWILQQQANTLYVGLGTNWVDVAGSASLTATNLPVMPAAPSVFYRLRYPLP